MPVIDIPEFGPAELPDNLTDEQLDAAVSDIYDREVKKKGLAAERMAAERPSAWETVGRVADVVASPTYGLGRISLGGLGRLAGAGMADLITPQIPGMAPNIAAELMGMERPIQTQVALEESPVRSGLVKGAETLPTIGAGIATAGLPGVAGLGVAAFPLAMGAQAAESSGGYVNTEVGKALAMGVALPVVGKIARTAAGIGTAAVVNRGVTALAPAGVQRAIEFGAGQAGVQGLLLADILASPEYRAATPEQKKRILIENGIPNALLGAFDVASAMRARPIAERFLSPSVQAARMLEADPSIPTPPLEQLVMPGREPIAQVGGVSEMGPIRTPGRAVIAGPPNVQQQPVAVDILPAGIISPSVVGPRIEPPRPVVIESGPLIVPEVAGVRPEAPTLLRNVPDMTADALRAEARATSQPPTPPESAKAEVPPPSPVPPVERVTPDAGGEVGPETRTPQRGGQGGEAQEQPEAEVTKPTERTPSEIQKEVQGQEVLSQPTLTDRIVAGLESLKKPETPGTRSGGVPISTYNLAIDTAIKAVKAGKTTADAINEAVGYAKSRGPVDEPALRKALSAGIPAIVTPTQAPQAPPAQASQTAPPTPPTTPEATTSPGRVQARIEMPGLGLRGNLIGETSDGKPIIRTDDGRTVTISGRKVILLDPAPTAAPPKGTTPPPTQRPPTTPPPPAGPPRPPKTLEDAYKVFQPATRQAVPIKERARRAVEAIRTGFFSKYRPLSELDETVRRTNGQGKRPQELAAYFETLKGASGQAELDVLRFDEAIAPHLAAIEPKDFNAYMMARRTIDRLTQDPTVKQVSDWTIGDAQNVIGDLQRKLSPAQQTALAEAGRVYNEHMDAALRSMVDSGRMSQDTYDAIKNANNFYAPFKVMRYMIEQEALPSGTGRQVDTQAELTKRITGIHDPEFRLVDMMAAGRQQIATARILAEKNRRMQTLSDLAATDTQGQFIRRLGPNEDPARGKADVTVMENGEPVHYEVEPRVAEAVKLHNATTGGFITKALTAAAYPMRLGATSANIVFQAVNLAGADLPRLALMSKLGIRNVLDLYRFPIDFLHGVWASATGNKLVPGVAPAKLHRDYLESGAAGATIQSYLTPDALQYRPPSGIGKANRFLRSVITSPLRFGNAIEETSKLIGLKRAMRISKTTSGAELARRAPELITEVRRFAGSPDFGRSGRLTDAWRLNLLFMFANARIQGAASDIGRLAGRDGFKPGGAAWLRLTTAVGLPTVLTWLYNQRPEYKEDYDKLSEQEKRNYFLIPKDDFIVNDQGQRVRDYARIPKRETVKLVSNMIETGMEFWQKRDPESLQNFATSALEDLAPVNVSGRNITERGESVISSMNPLAKAPLELFTGRQTYLHRDVITDERMKRSSPEQQFTKRTNAAYKKLAVWMPDWAPDFMRSPLRLENLTQNLTAGMFTQFMPTKGIEGREGIETWRFLRRFQTTGYIDNPKFRDKMEALERQQADESLARERTSDQIVADAKGDIKAAEALTRKAFATDPAGVERVKEKLRQNQTGVTPEDKRLLQLAPKQRAQFIAEQIAVMPKEDSTEYLKTLRQRRVLSDQTVLELRKLQALLAPQPQ